MCTTARRPRSRLSAGSPPSARSAISGTCHWWRGGPGLPGTLRLCYAVATRQEARVVRSGGRCALVRWSGAVALAALALAGCAIESDDGIDDLEADAEAL